MSLLSNSAAVIRDYDNEHYLHPWEAMWLTDGADRTITARAENIYVYDPDGKRLIDGPGGMWCMQKPAGACGQEGRHLEGEGVSRLDLSRRLGHGKERSKSWFDVDCERRR